VEEVRDSIRRVTDEQLINYGKAAAYMSRPKATLGRPPLEAFLIQSDEARAESRRHQPGYATGGATRREQQSRGLVRTCVSSGRERAYGQ